jgi:hypothetical protein
MTTDKTITIGQEPAALMKGSVSQFYNFLSDENIKILNKIIDDVPKKIDDRLGRNITVLPQSSFLSQMFDSVLAKLSVSNLTLSSTTYVEYNNKYGIPNLPPHFDSDINDLVISYQLKSNTDWNFAVEKQIYALKDNSILVFNANKNIHWRPHKIFKDDEFVKMIFFRFCNIENKSDNSHLVYSIDHEIFKEINELRDSLINNDKN